LMFTHRRLMPRRSANVICKVWNLTILTTGHR
jgi:hypothetical protein